MSREELDEIRCTNPDCPCGGEGTGPIAVSPQCHKDGLEARYDSMAGVLTLSCRTCSRDVVHVIVAETTNA